ncbi:MAG: hypothetical protein DRQ41_08925 [Gammaproteobacteria bacterium]|nr:MAG: hypothetical protein DRQ41_08925 [Gammaproteobacteria bacterium]
MKIYITLLLLLIVTSLVGCNTVVTKHSAEKTAQTYPVVNNTVHKSQESDFPVNVNLRIDEKSIDLALSYAEVQQDALFSTRWTSEDSQDKIRLPKNEERHLSIIQVSKVENASPKGKLATNVSTQKTGNLSKPVISRLAKKTRHKSRRASKPAQKTRMKPKRRASKFAKRTRRLVPSSFKQKLTEQTLSASQMIANIIAEEISDAESLTAYHKQSLGKDDLWKRIREGYGLAMVDNSQVQSSIEEYVKFSAYFDRIARNATPYIYHIVEEIEKRGMPLEIALLPAIESAYKPMALSHKSAAGLWQFVPATGKYYGLVQNKWYDGRRDIISSTRAALDYLQKLHRSFDEDWLIALAAYNYGPGNLRKAIKKNRALEKPTDFWSLDLPKETRKYVPKLLAVSTIVANPQEYGIKLQPIANYPYLKQVNIGQQINLSLVARLAGISPTALKRLNPGYRRDATAPMGPHYIILPIHKVSRFKQRLAKIPTHLMLTKVEVLEKGHFQLAPQPSVKTNLLSAAANPQKHQVRKGDSLWRIAERYGITVTSLRQWNQLEGKSLRIGQHLIVGDSVSQL